MFQNQYCIYLYALEKENVRFMPTRIKVSTTNPAHGPDIAIGQSGITAEEPITVGELMKQTVTKIPDRVALRYKMGDTWNHVTYQQYYDHCIAAAKSFVKVIYRFSTVHYFNCACISELHWIPLALIRKPRPQTHTCIAYSCFPTLKFFREQLGICTADDQLTFHCLYSSFYTPYFYCMYYATALTYHWALCAFMHFEQTVAARDKTRNFVQVPMITL